MTKKKPKNEHKPNGRPTVMTPETIGKLEQVFSKGFTDRQACVYVGVHPTTLYYYCELNPDFSDRKEALKQNPTIIAKQNVYDKIASGDDVTSKWWLERKEKAEFSLRNEVTGKDGEAIQTDNKITVEFIIPKIDPKDTKTEKTPKK